MDEVQVEAAFCGTAIRKNEMVNTLYFDAFNGVAGDMILGALIDLGLPLDLLEERLLALGLEGYSLSADTIERQGLHGVNFQVHLGGTGSGQNHHHSHGAHEHHHTHDSARVIDEQADAASDHHHHGEHRHYSQIKKMIERSTLGENVKTNALAIFENLAKAEAKVHQSDLETVHFHEVGAVDAIVDIVGACIGFDYFQIEEFYCSPIELGGGTVTFSHGSWPVPAPATAELVKGFPTTIGRANAELTTPTGAAILTTLASPSGEVPETRWEKSGFGAGNREFHQIPNVLRLMLGFREEGETIPEEKGGGFVTENLLLLEANIDDMEAEMFGHFLDTAMEAGALDVFFTPVQMKKNRPGVLLSVLCRPEHKSLLMELMFRETTTIGIRSKEVERSSLEREIRVIQTGYGDARVKVCLLNGKPINVAWEYDDLRQIAREAGIPLKEIRRKLEKRLAEVES
ncbi:MAG: nickel pincer cofactor biosynthesis protein LarC [Candidatus Bathyarchaeota archaeon]|nr:nickel pincer cofactor biosynthesis protein LarC [Candidatus Bathyarchaeota archaeon]